MNKNSLYRMSALIYRDGKQSLSKDVTIRKVIESLFVINQNKEIAFENLSTEIELNFSLLFHDKELEGVLDESYFQTRYSEEEKDSDGNKDLLLKLKDDRYKYLRDLQEENNIYRYIIDFYRESDLINEGIEESEFTKLIEDFLYIIFIQNLEKSRDLFNKKLDINDLVEQLTFSDEKKELINRFLDYDNRMKDKAIFEIGSWAIEFATVTGDIDLSGQINNITSKTLYLDTNVLFRLIGIDGERRQKRLYIFLKRCKDSGQELRVSKTVMDEYNMSFEIGIKKISEIAPTIKYTEPIDNSIVRHYFNQKSNSIDLYLAEVKATFEKYIRTLSLEIETNDLYREFSRSERLEVTKLSESIRQYKHQSNQYQSGPDATNYVYIRKLRKGQETNFNDAMYFFLTVDKSLTKWEQENLEGCPVTMRPSDWLSLLLKYVSRTEDDYKAFVSFIKQVIQPEQRDQDTVVAMLEGISQIVDKLENQKEIYSILVQQHYEKITYLRSYDEQMTYSRDTAYSILEERLQSLEKASESSKKEAIEFREKFENVDSTLEKAILEKQKEREKHVSYIVDNETAKRKSCIRISTSFFSILCIAIVLTWFFTNTSWNMIYNNISSANESIIGNQIGLTGLVLVALAPSVNSIYQNLYGEKTLKNRLIREGLTQEEIKNLD